MESITQTSSPTSLLRKHKNLGLGADNGLSANTSFDLKLGNRGSVSLVRRWKALVVQAKNDNRHDHKRDAHSFVPKPDESGFFPEAVLLKKKKVQEDGKLLPEFADEEEQELYETLNLQLQSELNVERMRHYEVVYLIHEKHEEEVGSVNDKVQDFLREKKVKIWRVSDWGLRRLAYKIQKAKRAHYILMNFEMEARWINDFKTLLDKDERVIRHLVMKQDEAITKDCPPPPEWHTLRADGDDYDEEEGEDNDEEFDDDDIYVEDWDEAEDGEQIYNDNDDGENSIASGSEDVDMKRKAHQLL